MACPRLMLSSIRGRGGEGGEGGDPPPVSGRFSGRVSGCRPEVPREISDCDAGVVQSEMSRRVEMRGPPAAAAARRLRRRHGGSSGAAAAAAGRRGAARVASGMGGCGMTGCRDSGGQCDVTACRVAVATTPHPKRKQVACLHWFIRPQLTVSLVCKNDGCGEPRRRIPSRQGDHGEACRYRCEAGAAPPPAQQSRLRARAAAARRRRAPWQRRPFGLAPKHHGA